MTVNDFFSKWESRNAEDEYIDFYKGENKSDTLIFHVEGSDNIPEEYLNKEIISFNFYYDPCNNSFSSPYYAFDIVV